MVTHQSFLPSFVFSFYNFGAFWNLQLQCVQGMLDVLVNVVSVYDFAHYCVLPWKCQNSGVFLESVDMSEK